VATNRKSNPLLPKIKILSVNAVPTTVPLYGAVLEAAAGSFCLIRAFWPARDTFGTILTTNPSRVTVFSVLVVTRLISLGLVLRQSS